MIMRQGHQLLLPVNPVFLWFTLVAALAINMLPFGRQPWIPDLLALVIVFWSVRQPTRVGLGAFFLFGLCMDVQQSALLGQHALSYSVLGYFAITAHRRLLWYRVLSQAVLVLPLLVLSQLIELVIRMINGGIFPGWSMLLSPLIGAALWPIVTVLLLAPQRRAIERDESRPI